ncbi:thioredoxin [Bacteroidales bacterium OttesenSCG-928-J19]|nr:thioredoxin [Bacteroidales bacterium OttesenSCG-928-J19]
MENFKDIINGSKPVLVDFYAEWCGPCKMMHPIIDELGKELNSTKEGRVLKIDIDKNQSLANMYRIQAVPTLVIFKDGEVKWRASGVTDKQTLLGEIRKFC